MVDAKRAVVSAIYLAIHETRSDYARVQHNTTQLRAKVKHADDPYESNCATREAERRTGACHWEQYVYPKAAQHLTIITVVRHKKGRQQTGTLMTTGGTTSPHILLYTADEVVQKTSRLCIHRTICIYSVRTGQPARC